MSVRFVWVVMGDAGYGDGRYVRAVFSSEDAARAFVKYDSRYTVEDEFAIDRPELG